MECKPLQSVLFCLFKVWLLNELVVALLNFSKGFVEVILFCFSAVTVVDMYFCFTVFIVVDISLGSFKTCEVEFIFNFAKLLWISS